MVHLGMSGSLRIMPAGTPPLFHDHIDVVLDDGISATTTRVGSAAFIGWTALLIPCLII